VIKIIIIKILFSWNNGDLILRTRKPGDSQILQFIPRSTLSGDFPGHFVEEYTHWLDLNTRELEFRPAGSPWTPAPSNWRLYIHKPGTHAHPRAILQKPSQDSSIMQLIDIRSKTFAVVTSLLSPVESPGNIIVTHASHSLEVSLPRLHLSFFVNSNWELECRSIPGYVVDKTQSCGTMFGLRNKLVLCPRPNSSEESLLPRRVIIPQGEISFRTDGDFTGVTISTTAEQHVRWHEYTVDTDLGCLRSNTSLNSKLYQCYLHALTSHCLSDPLLGHTGTEEALLMLQSAACRSFQRLNSHDARLLELISNLTPDRVYYPPHLQSMTTVKWNDLPALSQHHDFYRVACSILDHARELEALYDQPVVFDTPDRNQSLLKRAALRNKSYYPSDLQILEKPSSLNDVKYRSRDTPSRGNAEHVAYRTSWSIWNARPSHDSKLPNLWDLMNSWGSVGPAGSGISLRYSQYWLGFDAARDWLVIHDLCRKVVNENTQKSRIELLFCLSAAAYGISKYADMVPVLMIFALDERCRDLIPPQESSYIFSDGVVPRLTRLKDLVSGSALPIEMTPARSSRVGMTKTNNVDRQRMAQYDSIVRGESSVVAESILHQWPVYEPVNLPEQWFNRSECNRRIDEYIHSISRNIQLKEYVLQLQNILQHYKNVSIPAAVPYTFSPQFLTGSSKVPSYSIRDVLVSRTNVPTPSTDGESFPGGTIPTAETDSSPPPAGSDNLGILIEELRNYPQLLLQLYGNELSKSHRERLGQNASQSAHGALPSHELLRLYHEECSRRKDRLFSEISAALAPSQDVEKTNGIAGLWPRITPRSILSQLAQDRIGTLPDQWKIVITRFAAYLLKKQQSVRLLKLLSRQKREEMFREIEAIREDVLAESTPDWLLVQVSPLLRRRSDCV
jgi:hypothetical protein